MNCKHLMVGLLINTSELAMALSHMFVPGIRLQYVSALQVLCEWVCDDLYPICLKLQYRESALCM